MSILETESHTACRFSTASFLAVGFSSSIYIDHFEKVERTRLSVVAYK